MYKIYRGDEIYGQGTPIIVTTAWLYGNDFYLEHFTLVIDFNGNAVEALPPQLTTYKNGAILLRKDEVPQKLEERSLKHEFNIAKGLLSQWLYSKIGNGAFRVFRELKWEETGEFVDLALVVHSAPEIRKAFAGIASQTNEGELKKTIERAAGLKISKE